MLELVVSLEGKHSMGLMPQNRRSPQARPVTAGQNGAFVAAVVGPERRAGNQSPRTTSTRTVKRKLRTRKHPPKYMLLRTSRMELKVSICVSVYEFELCECIVSEG